MSNPAPLRPLTAAEQDDFAAAEGSPAIFGGTAPEIEDHEPDDVQALLRREYRDAATYRLELAEDRARAWHYYEGGGFGDEIDGRSKIVSRDLRDTALAIMPSLVRIFLSSEHVMEFQPRGPEGEDAAHQRTRYLNLVLREDNPGFRIHWDAMLDALVSRYAPIKWFWDETQTRTTETYEGLTSEQVMSLVDQEDILSAEEELMGSVSIPDGEIVEGSAPEIPLFRVRVVREKKGGVARYMAIPGEEFFISRDARTVKEAAYVAHVRVLPYADVLSMGFPEEVVLPHKGTPYHRLDDVEYLQRHQDDPSHRPSDNNPELEGVLYGEHYARIRHEGVVQLCRIVTLGEDLEVVDIEPMPERPLTLLTPLPRPHRWDGDGLFQLLGDLQRIKSAVLRATMDSLRSSLDPRMGADENRVNFDDLANQELGGIVRTNGPPGETLLPLTIPFAGEAGLRVLDYLDTVKETRVGVTRGSQGLNADALQSTTAVAVSAQMSAAQQRIEMIARIFAESGFRDLYMGLQRLLMRHQDTAREVRLAGIWTAVDPSTWNVPLDVVVNSGLGTGVPEDRVAMLKEVAGKQEQILQQMGPSPLVTYRKYRNTLAKIVESSGFPDASRFFGDVGDDWAPPPPPEKPDPAELLAQTQHLEIQTRAATEQAKLQQAMLEAMLKTETERMRIEADMHTKILALEARHQVEIDEARIQREIEGIRAYTQARVREIKSWFELQAAQAALAPAPEAQDAPFV